jgi:hypothetical protein
MKLSRSKILDLLNGTEANKENNNNTPRKKGNRSLRKKKTLNLRSKSLKRFNSGGDDANTQPVADDDDASTVVQPAADANAQPAADANAQPAADANAQPAADANAQSVPDANAQSVVAADAADAATVVQPVAVAADAATVAQPADANIKNVNNIDDIDDVVNEQKEDTNVVDCNELDKNTNDYMLNNDVILNNKVCSKKDFREIQLKVHPDKNNCEESQEKFKKINKFKNDDNCKIEFKGNVSGFLGETSFYFISVDKIQVVNDVNKLIIDIKNIQIEDNNQFVNIEGNNNMDIRTDYNDMIKPFIDKYEKHKKSKVPKDVVVRIFEDEKDDYSSVYLQPQENLGCGRHALNNIIGKEEFKEEDLKNICKKIHENLNTSKDGSEILKNDFCNDKEYYDISILLTALDNVGLESRGLLSIELKSSDLKMYDELKKIVTELESENNEIFGFIVNNGNHWYTIKKINKKNVDENSEDYIKLDSLKPNEKIKNKLDDLKEINDAKGIIIVYNNKVDNENVDNENVDNENVDNENVDNQNVDNQNVDNENVDNENVDNQNVDNQNVDNENVNVQEQDINLVPGQVDEDNVNVQEQDIKLVPGHVEGEDEKKEDEKKDDEKKDDEKKDDEKKDEIVKSNTANKNDVFLPSKQNKKEYYTVNIPIPGSKNSLNGKITFILPKNALSSFGKTTGNTSEDTLRMFANNESEAKENEDGKNEDGKESESNNAQNDEQISLMQRNIDELVKMNEKYEQDNNRLLNELNELKKKGDGNGEDKKEEGEDKKEDGEDKKEDGEDKKEEGEYKKEDGEDKKEEGEDKKEDGEDKKEDGDGKKEDGDGNGEDKKKDEVTVEDVDENKQSEMDELKKQMDEEKKKCDSELQIEKDKLAELQKQLDKEVEEKKNNEVKGTDLQVELDNLKKQMEDEKKKSETDLQSEKDKLAELQKQLEEVNKQVEEKKNNDAKESESKESESKDSDLQVELDKVKKQMDDEKKKCDDEKIALTNNFENEKIALTKQIDDEKKKSETDLQSEKDKLAELQKQLEEVNKQVEEKKNDEVKGNDLQVELDNLKKQLEEEKKKSETDLQSEKDKLAELQKQLEEVNKQVEEKKNDEVKGNDLQVELDNLKKQMEEEKKKSDDDKIALTTQIDEEKKKSETDLQSEKDKLAELQKQLEEVNKQVEEKKNDEVKGNNLQVELDNLKKQMEEEKKKSDEEKIALTNNFENEKIALTKQTEINQNNANEEKQKSETEIQQLKDQLKIATDNLNAEKERCMNELKEEKEKCEKDKLEIQSQKDALENNKNKIDEEKKQIDEEKKVCEDIKTKFETLQKELNDVKSQLEKANTDKQALQKEIDEIKVQFEQVNANKKACDETKVQLEQTNSNIQKTADDAKAQLETVNSEKTALQKTADDATTQLKQVNSDKDALQKAADDAKAQLETVNTEKTALQKAADDAKAQLENANQNSKTCDETKSKLENDKKVCDDKLRSKEEKEQKDKDEFGERLKKALLTKDIANKKALDDAMLKLKSQAQTEGQTQTQTQTQGQTQDKDGLGFVQKKVNDYEALSKDKQTDSKISVPKISEISGNGGEPENKKQLEKLILDRLSELKITFKGINDTPLKVVGGDINQEDKILSWIKILFKEFSIMNTELYLKLMTIISYPNEFKMLFTKIFPGNDVKSGGNAFINLFFVELEDDDIILSNTNYMSDSSKEINTLNYINRDTFIYSLYDNTSKSKKILIYTLCKLLEKSNFINSNSMFSNATDATRLGNYIIALIVKFTEINKKYVELKKQPTAIKNIYDKIINEKKNIYTFVRERTDVLRNPRYTIETPDNILKIKYINTDKNNDEVKKMTANDAEEYQFGSFDKIYRNTSNKTISDEFFDKLIWDKATNTFKKNDICILGLGQSGSGKTSTLVFRTGDTSKNSPDEDGVLIEIFKNKKITDKFKEVSVDITEIYLDNLKDGVKIVPLENYGAKDLSKNTKFKFTNNKWFLQNGDVIDNKVTLGGFILDKMDNQRMVDPTPNNPVSSRSHVVICLTVGEKKIIFLDLAGNENEFICDINDALKFYNQYINKKNVKNRLENKVFNKLDNKCTNKSTFDNENVIKNLDKSNDIEIQNLNRQIEQIQLENDAKINSLNILQHFDSVYSLRPNSNIYFRDLTKEQVKSLQEYKQLSKDKNITISATELKARPNTKEIAKNLSILRLNMKKQIEESNKKIAEVENNIKNLTTKNLTYKCDIEKIDLLVKECVQRKKEGYMINQSIGQMIKDIQSIMIKKLVLSNGETGTNYLPIFFETQMYPYCQDLLKDQDKYERFYEEPSETALSGKILNVIADPQGMNLDISKIDFAIFTVINTSSEVNNPPNPPYININSLIYHTKIVPNEQKQEKELNNVLDRIKEYNYYYSKETEKYNDNITKLLIYDTNTKSNLLINSIDTINQTTLIGTLESTDKLKHYVFNDIPCYKNAMLENELAGISNEEDDAIANATAIANAMAPAPSKIMPKGGKQKTVRFKKTVDVYNKTQKLRKRKTNHEKKKSLKA